MTAKEYLGQYQMMRMEVKSLADRRDYYLGLAQKCTPAYGVVPGGSGSNEGKTARYVDKAVDKARELEARLNDLIELEREIEGVIAQISDATARSILTCRYINGWNLKEIADRMGYDRDYMRHLHGDALGMVVVPIKYHT